MSRLDLRLMAHAIRILSMDAIERAGDGHPGAPLGCAGMATAHGGRIFSEDTAAAREHLGWPYPPFVIPDDILSAWRAAGRRNQPEHDAWQERAARLAPEKRRLLNRLREGRLPDGWQEPLRTTKDRQCGLPR